MAENHEQLMLKKLLGTITSEENVAFNAWVRSNPENKRTYEDYKKLWRIRQAEAPEFSPHGEWKNLEPKLNNTKVRSLGFYLSEAAAILLLCVASYLVYEGLKNRIQVYESGEKIIKVTLNDSSKVFLKPNTVLTVSGRYGRNNRSVQIDGEGYFEVKPDKAKPFVVKGGLSRIEVLGTSFMVNSRQDGQTNEVLVLSGRVKMSPLDDAEKEVILTSGMKGTVDQNGKNLSMSKADTTNLLAWRSRKLSFNKTELAEVVKTLEDYFLIKITVKNQELLQCRFTSTFNDPKVEEVIEALSGSMNINVMRQGVSFTFEGGWCK